MRTIAIGDIHGGLKALQQLLSKIQLTTSDQLIFLGDYVDGWSDSYMTIDYLISLSRKQDQHKPPIFLMGNHDELLLHYLKHKKHNPQWLAHGGQNTLEQYNNNNPKDIQEHITFLESLLPYHIDQDNNGYFHAGFHNPKGPQFEYYHNITYWDRTLWELALCVNPKLNIENDRYPKRLSLFKEIFIGHTPTSRLGTHAPIHAANVWNIDTGAAYKGPLTAICIETKQVWQSDPVHQFYPNENGRN